MKIWIHHKALAGVNNDLLWPGALYGSKRLLEMNCQLDCDPSRLSDRQKALLDNEQIRFAGFGEEKADARIILDEKTGQLQLQAAGEPSAAGTDWIILTREFLFPNRTVTHTRKSAETDIEISLNLDGTGVNDIDTGLNFFDHMLEQIARHGLIDLKVRCTGDLEVDEHHTIEDVAITLGEALYKVCGTDKTGIQRYGFLLAMDESQAEVALDLSNRPYLVWNADFSREYVGDFPMEMAEHFFHSLAMNLKATLQVRADGQNDHHKIESIFKGFAKALRFAVTRTERAKGILPSSKGRL
jgi:imidazoleglycerol-phosphate dehydratase / histidinol-phosphatase